MSDDDAPAPPVAEALARVERELESCKRDLSGFAHVVSHDLRGPLSVILGFASLIKEREVLPEGDPARSHLDEILIAGARIDTMVAALVHYVRVGQAPLTREPMPVAELARKVWRNLGKTREVAQRAVIQIERMPAVSADAVQLELLLVNLLDNALRFADPHDPRVRFGRASEQPGEVFCVEDNGPGFDPAQAQRLFLPFQQLSAGQRGAGVGLATCARIVARHGGRIWAECHPERGARFYFSLGG